MNKPLVSWWTWKTPTPTTNSTVKLRQRLEDAFSPPFQDEFLQGLEFWNHPESWGVDAGKLTVTRFRSRVYSAESITRTSRHSLKSRLRMIREPFGFYGPKTRITATCSSSQVRGEHRQFFCRIQVCKRREKIYFGTDPSGRKFERKKRSIHDNRQGKRENDIT